MNDLHRKMNHHVLTAVLIVISAVSLFAAFHYRNALIARNRSYVGTSSLPVYRNGNYVLNLIRCDPRAYDQAIVFIGSSLIQRWDFGRHFPERPYVNRGVEANTSSDLLRRFDEDVLSLNPKRAVIYISSNDVRSGIPPEKSIDNLDIMLARCRRAGIAPMVLILAPVLYDINPSLKLSHPLEDIERLHRHLVSYCTENNVPFADTYEWISETLPMTREIFIKDGLHLNETGYDRLSSWFISQIENESTYR